MEKKEGYRVVMQSPPAPAPVLYGLKRGAEWWCEANGVVFHTPYRRVAEVQCQILQGREQEPFEVTVL